MADLKKKNRSNKITLKLLAAASATTPNETQLTTCDACSKTFQEPKLLSCMDTFCYKCLEELLSKQSQVRGSIICPTCGESTTIPDNGLQGLPDNSFATTLIKINKLNEEQKNRKLACSACSRLSTGTTELAVAVVFCVVCEDKLCKACSDAHSKLKITTDHRLVPLDENFIAKLSESRQSKPTSCQEHSDQLYTLYCPNTECEKPICLKCAVLTHKSHDYIDIVEVAKDLRTDLLEAAEGLHGKHVRIVQQLQILERRKDLVQKSTNKVETQLGQRRDEVLSLIETGRKGLVTSAENIHGQKMHTLREAEMALTSRLSDLQNALAFGQVLYENGNDAEVSCMLQQFQLKVDQVASHQIYELPEDVDVQLVFNAAQSTADILDKTSVVFGSVATTEDVSTEGAASICHLTKAVEAKPQQSTLEDAVHSEDVDYKRRQHAMPNWKSPRLIGKITGKNCVRGVAIIGDRLFVVHKLASKVDIYDAGSLATVGKFNVSGLDDATDMAACSTTKRIYISSKSHSSVFCVQLLVDCKADINVHKLQRRPFGISVAPNLNILVAHPKNECFAEFTADMCHSSAFSVQLLSDCKPDINVYKLRRQPFGISISPNFNVLVAHPRNNCFTEFTADMCLVRVVETPGMGPYHVVFLTDNRFVISGGDWSNSVSIWSVDGEKSASGNAVAVCKHEMDTFKRPTHIAVDANRNILVVDSHHHRIVITDSKLSTLFDFRDQYTGGLHKICLNSDASKLYLGIADCVKGVFVLQYDIRF